MKHRILSLILIVAVLCSAALAVSAVDVPDLSRTGTISIVMHMGETLIPGGSLTLYRVGEIHEDDGNYSFVPTGVFKDCVSVFEDVQDPILAQQLAAFTDENKLPGIHQIVDENGTATFTDLELGLYLVMQHTAAPGYSKAEPFLLGVPQVENGMYIYDVYASPKVDLERIPETTSPTVPTTEEPPYASGGKLPQSGQLMWPIPVLAVAGLAFIVLGIAMRKRSAEEE